jgi:hypothetical protein
MDDSQSVDFKFVESYFKDKLARPFSRRLKHIYFGLDGCDDVLVLSDTEDTEFKYCEPMQTTGLVKIVNAEHLEKITRWFDHCQIDRTTASIFYFSRVITLLNKLSWSDPAITYKRDLNGIVEMTLPDGASIVIAQPIETHFTLTKLQSFADKYSKVFFEDQGHVFDVPTAYEKVAPVTSLSVSCADLYESGLLDTHCEDIKLVLLAGLDLLVTKSLIGKDREHTTGVRLWADNGKRCINFGGFYRDADVSICSSRDNIFIFPVKKKE